MEFFGVTGTERSGTAVTLAGIATELSSIAEWKTSVQNALSLLRKAIPHSTISLGLKVVGWEVFYCPAQHKLHESESTLLQHYLNLTVESHAATPHGDSQESNRSDGESSSHAAGNLICLPIIGGKRILGVLHAKGDSGKAFSQREQSLVFIAASQIGSFVRNVLSYMQQLSTIEQIENLLSEAERRIQEIEGRQQLSNGASEALRRQVSLLQRALLPSTPCVIEGYRIAYTFIPAFADQQIGGDFFDVFRAKDGKVGLVIGDVSGKGIEAAALAATTRSTVRAFAYDLVSAGHALTHANSVLAQDLADPASFVTVFIAILDPVTGRISYSGAGHPPAAIRRSDGGVEFLTYGDPPICLIDGQKYKQSQSYLGPGDNIIMYTDGVSDAHNGSDLFGFDGLRQTLEEHGAASLETLVDQIVLAARNWSSGGTLRDDTAILAVQREI